MNDLEYPDDYYDFDLMMSAFAEAGISLPGDKIGYIKEFLCGKENAAIAEKFNVSVDTVRKTLGKTVYRLIDNDKDFNVGRNSPQIAIAYFNQRFLKQYVLKNEKPANIFWSGHDLMWTIDAVELNHSCDSIRHGLKQLLYQLKEANVFTKCSSIRVIEYELLKFTKLSQSHQLKDDERNELIELLKDTRKELGAVINSLQPDYKPFPSENKNSWFEQKKKRNT